jgi:hypothetical protein
MLRLVFVALGEVETLDILNAVPPVEDGMTVLVDEGWPGRSRGSWSGPASHRRTAGWLSSTIDSVGDCSADSSGFGRSTRWRVRAVS